MAPRTSNHLIPPELEGGFTGLPFLGSFKGFFFSIMAALWPVKNWAIIHPNKSPNPVWSLVLR